MNTDILPFRAVAHVASEPRDMSAGSPQSSAAALSDSRQESTTSEAELARGYAPSRTVPCACGRPLVVSGGQSIENVVRRHQLTADHIAWREEMGL